jgi:catechol 2,3-dioxygenase-like lactoylglutathione lyase family enzyme
MSATVRYIVHDAATAAAFYRDHLGFDVLVEAGPGFAMLRRDDLRLLLNAPGAGGAGQGDGEHPPEPGGWNRIQLDVTDVRDEAARLEREGIPLRSPVIEGNGGSQVLVADPSGNLVELLEPRQD